MRIIKLEVEQYGDRGIKLFKYAVSLDLKKYQKVASFIAYIQKICKLDKLSYELEIDGFQISKYDRTKALKENVVYKLRISHSTKKDYHIRSSQVEDSDDEADPEVKIKTTDKKSKVQQKVAKIARKKKKESSSESDSSSSSSDQDASSSSSSSSESSQQVLPKQVKQKQKEKKVNPRKNEPENPKQPIKPSKSQTPKKIKNVPAFAKKPVPMPESSSSSSSSQESEEELPTLIQNKKQIPTVVKSSVKPNLPIKPQQIPQEKRKQPSNLFINPQKQAVINGDSSSESEPSQQYHPKKKPQITEKPRQKTEINKPQTIPSAVITNVKPKIDIKLPPALRNKVLVKKNFDQHKQNQWICIDKQKMKRWQELGNKNVCQVNNKIRFKIVELDEQKFIPVKSGWITGQVKEVRENRTVCLAKVEQEGKPFRQTYEIPEHNMDELQINRLFATMQQVECFEQKQEQAPPKQAEKPIQQKKQSQSFDTQNDKNSIEKFICGQANYYFSDKNYNTDLFMQMHANRHPQKYINISFILNFPKIKKFLQNEQKLYQYLKSDEKYEQRNYEVDFVNRLIRKKSLIRKPEQAEKALQGTNKNEEKVPKDGEQLLQGGQLKSQ